jgi:hypothetical protein
MRESALELGGLPGSWPCLTLREKRVRLVVEELEALIAEARLLGIGYTELAERLRQSFKEEP